MELTCDGVEQSEPRHSSLWSELPVGARIRSTQPTKSNALKSCTNLEHDFYVLMSFGLRIAASNLPLVSIMFRNIKKIALLLYATTFTTDSFAHVRSFLGYVHAFYTFIPLDRDTSAPAILLTLHPFAGASAGHPLQSQLALPGEEYGQRTDHFLSMSSITRYQAQTDSQNCALRHQIPPSIQMGSLLLLLHQANLYQIPLSPLQVNTHYYHGSLAITLSVTNENQQVQVVSYVTPLENNVFDISSQVVHNPDIHRPGSTRGARYQMYFKKQKHTSRESCRPPRTFRADPEDNDRDHHNPPGCLDVFFTLCCAAARVKGENQPTERSHLVNGRQSAYVLPFMLLLPLSQIRTPPSS